MTQILVPVTASDFDAADLIEALRSKTLVESELAALQEILHDYEPDYDNLAKEKQQDDWEADSIGN